MKIKLFALLAVAFMAFAFVSCESTKQESKPAEPKQLTAEDLEYQRSVGAVGHQVSKETFNADKATILKTIEELNVIMSKSDFNSWVKYIDQESQTYWSNRANLLKYSERLPKEEKQKGKKLQSLKDYFLTVFIKSRRGRRIDEIRYNSAESIKAVQLRQKEDGSTEAVVYYNFIKENNEWKVYLPRL